MYHHHYSLNDLEDMIPWERAAYNSLIEKEKAAERERKQRR